MADFKYTVNKHTEQIDDLQKKSANHEKRIETIETRGLAIAPEQPVQMPAPIVTVSVPDNIATKENVTQAAIEAVKRQAKLTEESVKAMADKMIEAAKELSFPSSMSGNTSVDKTEYEKVAEAAATKAADKAVGSRYEKADRMYDHVMNRIHYLVDGAVWSAMPKCIYAVFGISVVAAIGFAILFFWQLGENTRLRDVEWEYRLSRTYFRSEAEQKLLVNSEMSFFKGTPHERDSIKNMIRQREETYGLDKLNLYFYPTEK